MNILLAEDDDDKLSQIQVFLDSLSLGDKRDTAKSLQSTLKLLVSESYDLLLLDMTMPNFDRTIYEDGGRPHAFGGREILRQMKRRRISTPVIVITQFDRFGEDPDIVSLEQLNQELQMNYENYSGIVQFRGNVDDWKQDLQELIFKIVKLEHGNDHSTPG